jgi:hypothetical protein
MPVLALSETPITSKNVRKKCPLFYANSSVSFKSRIAMTTGQIAPKPIENRFNKRMIPDTNRVATNNLNYFHLNKNINEN